MHSWHARTRGRLREAMELSERLIHYYAERTAPAINSTVQRDHRATYDLLCLVRDLSRRLHVWNTQRSSCRASEAHKAVQSFRVILGYCERILTSIKTGGVDREMLEFDYQDKAGVRCHGLRDVIDAQQSQMLGDKTKEAAIAAYTRAADAEVLAARVKTARAAERAAQALQSLRLLARDEG